MLSGFMNTLSESIFDAYTDEYEEWFNRNASTYLSELELLRMAIPKSGQGLEVGVGTGRFAAPLGVDLGIDPSENMLQVAKSRGIEVLLGRGEQIPFKDAVLDYVLIMVTICFVDEPNRIVEESRRAIKKDGRIIIGIIDRDSWLGKLYLARKSKSKFYREARFFSAGEVIELLKNNNFKDIKVYQTIFGNPAKLEMIQHHKEGCGEGGFAVIYGHK